MVCAQDTFSLAFVLAGEAEKYRQVRPTEQAGANTSQPSTCSLCSCGTVCDLNVSHNGYSSSPTSIPHLDKKQVSVGPGGVFRWGKDQLEIKATSNTSSSTADGWQLMGALQFDDAGVSVLVAAGVGLECWWSRRATGVYICSVDSECVILLICCLVLRCVVVVLLSCLCCPAPGLLPPHHEQDES